jgi:hypothetical protein
MACIIAIVTTIVFFVKVIPLGGKPGGRKLDPLARHQKNLDQKNPTKKMDGNDDAQYQSLTIGLSIAIVVDDAMELQCFFTMKKSTQWVVAMAKKDGGHLPSIHFLCHVNKILCNLMHPIDSSHAQVDSDMFCKKFAIQNLWLLWPK